MILFENSTIHTRLFIAKFYINAASEKRFKNYLIAFDI